DEDMRRAIDSAADFEAALEGLALISSIDALPMTTQAATAAEKAVGELATGFAEMTEAAEELGLSERRLARIREAERRQMEALRREREQATELEILGIENPFEAALQQGEAAIVELIRNTAAVGGDIADVERLAGLRRVEIAKRYAN